MSRNPLRAQLQTLAILGATLSVPGPSAFGRRSRQPTLREALVAGTGTTVVLPAGPPPWPALVFMNGATPDGRRHPTVHRLSLALARAGVCVFIPELDGIAGGELSPGTLAQSAIPARLDRPGMKDQGFSSVAFARSISSLTRWPPFFPIFS